jgi:fructose-1,6-bisphosphatase II
MGIGGTPEGIISACAMKCLGGEIQGRLKPKSDEERERAQAQGLDLTRVFTTNDLVKGDDVFFAATGITDGELLQGVRHGENYFTTNSIVMRGKTKTVRVITTESPISSILA